MDNPRLAWEPHFQVPQSDAFVRGNIFHDDYPSRQEPAVLLSLDAQKGRSVAITRKGWFLRSGEDRFPGTDIQRPLPDPLPTNNPQPSLNWFRGFLRLSAATHDMTWGTLLAWMLRALQPVGKPDFQNYPILVLTGPPGAGKTVAAKLLTELLDPTIELVHSLQSSERWFRGLIAKHHILSFDETGRIGPAVSRLLASASDSRAVIVTTTSRADVPHLDRVVEVQLPLVEKPRSQQEIWQEFAVHRPRILGAILTILTRKL